MLGLIFIHLTFALSELVILSCFHWPTKKNPNENWSFSKRSEWDRVRTQIAWQRILCKARSAIRSGTHFNENHDASHPLRCVDESNKRYDKYWIKIRFYSRNCNSLLNILLARLCYYYALSLLSLIIFFCSLSSDDMISQWCIIYAGKSYNLNFSFLQWLFSLFFPFDAQRFVWHKFGLSNGISDENPLCQNKNDSIYGVEKAFYCFKQFYEVFSFACASLHHVSKRHNHLSAWSNLDYGNTPQPNHRVSVVASGYKRAASCHVDEG